MMKRTLPELIGVLAFAALVNGNPTEAAAGQKPVNVATSPNPVVIAILSDHYTDETEFDLDVQNLIVNGLLANPYYASRKADLEVVSFYEPLKAGTQSNYGFNVEVPSGYCALSWTVSDDDATNTATLVDVAVSNSNPRHTIVIGDHPYNIGCTDGAWTYVATDVIGTDVLAHELGHGLANLYDEWFFASNAGVSHPGIPLNQTRNCYDTRHGARPPWMPPLTAPPGTVGNFPGAGSVAGCDFFELDVVHAYPPHPSGHNYCLMGATHGAEFCPVCQFRMGQAFNDAANPDMENPDVTNPDAQNPDAENPAPGAGSRIPKPPTNSRVIPGTKPPSPPRMQIMNAVFEAQTPKAQPPKGSTPATGTTKPATGTTGTTGATGSILKPAPARPIVRLVAAFDPVSGRLRLKKGIPITARYTPSHRRLGEWAYEVVVNGRTHVGVIPSNLFRSHSYQGGVAHQSSAPHEADITIQIPDVTADALKAGTANVSISIWLLSPNVTEELITPAVLAKLRKGGQAERRGQELTVRDLISVM